MQSKTEEMKALMTQADAMIPPDDVLAKYLKQAQYMVEAGMLPEGYTKAAQVVTIGLRAREMGVPFWQASQGMFPTKKGRIGYMGGFLMSRVLTVLPEAEIIIEESTAEICKLKFRRRKEADYQYEEFTYTEAHASHYDETWKDEKKAWETKPCWRDRKNMLYWRTLTRVINRWFSDVFGAPVYTQEELEDTDEDYVPPANEPSIPYQTAAAAAKASAEDANVVAPAAPADPGKTPEAPAAPARQEESAAKKSGIVGVAPLDEQGKQNGQIVHDECLDGFEADLEKLNTRKEIDEAFDKFKKDHQDKKDLWPKAFEIKRDRSQAVKS